MSKINFIKNTNKNGRSITVYDPMDKPNEESETLPARLYRLTEVGGMFDRKLAFESYAENDQLINFKSGLVSEVIKKCVEFFSDKTEEGYKALGLTRKMGLLFYGPPGTGKTSVSILIMKQIVESYNAIALDCTGKSLGMIRYAIKTIRNIQNNPIVLFMDEFDSSIRHQEEEILTFLDGSTSSNDVIFLGCTNYIDKIPDRIKKRKSRIKHCFEVKSLPESVYREYIINKVKNIDNDDLNKMMYFAQENSLTIDELKHAIIDWYIEGSEIEQAIKDAKKYESVE